MSQTKPTLCPCCDTSDHVETHHRKETIPVRGEPIEVPAEFFRCSACDCEFEPMDTDRDPLDSAYRIYRERHGLLQPEEIRAIRDRYGLTQKELSGLLGWGSVTLSRYETGALQDEAHNTALELVRDEKAFLSLLKKRGSLLRPEKLDALLQNLSALTERQCPLPDCLTDAAGSRKRDIYSGFQDLDLCKVYGMIRFFCTEGCFKTKLNKLLFYADFLHFSMHARSLSGLRYAHADHGPVPDKWELYFAGVQHEQTVRAVEHIIGDYVGELFFSDGADFSLFSEPEIRTLIRIKDFFAGWSAKRIRDYSHEERGWQETKSGELISYEFAEALRLSH
jgi:putative zinc finger/helix-turn-helix YgiT family protein